MLDTLCILQDPFARALARGMRQKRQVSWGPYEGRGIGKNSLCSIAILRNSHVNPAASKRFVPRVAHEVPAVWGLGFSIRSIIFAGDPKSQGP